MARLINFTGGQSRDPLSAAQIKSLQLSEILNANQGLNRPIYSGGQLGVELGSEALKALVLAKERQAAAGRETAQADNLKAALADRSNVSVSGIQPDNSSHLSPLSRRLAQTIEPKQFTPSPRDGLIGDPFNSEGGTSPRNPQQVGETRQLLRGGQGFPADLTPEQEDIGRGQEARLNFIQSQGNRLAPFDPLQATLRRPNTLNERIGILSQNKDNLPLAMQMQLQQEAAGQAAGVRAEENANLLNRIGLQNQAQLNLQKQGQEFTAGQNSLSREAEFKKQEDAFGRQKEILKLQQDANKQERIASQDFQTDTLFKQQEFKQKQFETEVDLKKKEIGIKRDLESAKNLQDLKNKNFSNEADLRKEYTKGSGEFLKVRDSFGRIQGSVADPSPAGDLAMIFNFMKMLDPGSTVREGEFATAANAGSIPTRITAIWNKIRAGERLAPEQRKDFFEQSLNLFSTMEQSQKALSDQYTGLAQRNGLNDKNVIVDFPVPKFEKPSLSKFGLDEKTFLKGTAAQGQGSAGNGLPPLPPGFIEVK